MLARCVLGGQTRAYITVNKMGLCKCLGALAFSMVWASSNTSARAAHSHGGPMQECRFTALPDVSKLCGPTQKSRVLPCCVIDWPIRATCPYITVHEMGPHEYLGTLAFSMVWANSNPSARAAHSHGGPMQEFSFTALPMSANYVGPHKSLECCPVV
jgi:hypothetical protein